MKRCEECGALNELVTPTEEEHEWAAKNGCVEGSGYVLTVTACSAEPEMHGRARKVAPEETGNPGSRH